MALLLTLAILTTAFATYPSKKTITIPSSPARGESKVDFTFHNGDSDIFSPKITPINSTVWEWWYFSTIPLSTTSLASLSIGFYTASQLAFPVNITTSSNVLFTSLSATFENGLTFDVADIRVRAVLREDGLVGLWDMGDTGDWDEYKMWVGSEDLKKWWVKWDKDIASEKQGVEGRVMMEAKVGSRIGCGGKGTQEVMPGVGWNMAVTDADVWVDVRVGEERVRFEGMGFVEKMWGARTFEEVGMPGAIWGWGRLGRYTVVW
ncbi:Tyrosinase family protein asqI [Pseudocercospora fuligena]|uniref:Tyrosinase family protein asqI n=1 Tax=Pseudocercospora fuligena TaxID=685502 RepID=A0A8H6RLE3_9PEZI|nr:Tyrosinase family protein asqI [Pseudocercospora fuligena]